MDNVPFCGSISSFGFGRDGKGKSSCTQHVQKLVQKLWKAKAGKNSLDPRTTTGRSSRLLMQITFLHIAHRKQSRITTLSLAYLESKQVKRMPASNWVEISARLPPYWMQQLDVLVLQRGGLLAVLT